MVKQGFKAPQVYFVHPLNNNSADQVTCTHLFSLSVTTASSPQFNLQHDHRYEVQPPHTVDICTLRNSFSAAWYHGYVSMYSTLVLQCTMTLNNNALNNKSQTNVSDLKDGRSGVPPHVDSTPVQHSFTCLTQYNNNNCIQRRYSSFLTHSAANSPTHTLKWPRRNRVQITCNTSSAYHVQHVVLRATWYEGTAQLLSLAESKLHLFELYFVG